MSVDSARASRVWAWAWDTTLCPRRITRAFFYRGVIRSLHNPDERLRAERPRAPGDRNWELVPGIASCCSYWTPQLFPIFSGVAGLRSSLIRTGCQQFRLQIARVFCSEVRPNCRWLAGRCIPGYIPLVLGHTIVFIILDSHSPHRLLLTAGRLRQRRPTQCMARCWSWFWFWPNTNLFSLFV